MKQTNILVIILIGIFVLAGCTDNPLATNVVKKKTDTTKEVDKIKLPADPGEAGKKTLEGIDSDKDGLRDDIQIFIHKKYGSTPKDLQNAIRQLMLITLEEQRVGAKAPNLNEIKAELFNRLNALSGAALGCLEIMHHAYYKNQTDLERDSAINAIIKETYRIVDNTEERFKATKRVSKAMAGGNFGGNFIDHFNDCNFKIEMPLAEQKKAQKAYEDYLGEVYMELNKQDKRYFKDEKRPNSESVTGIKMSFLTNNKDNICEETGTKEVRPFYLNGMSTTKHEAQRDTKRIDKVIRGQLGIDKEILKKFRTMQLNYVDSYSTRVEVKKDNKKINSEIIKQLKKAKLDNIKGVNLNDLYSYFAKNEYDANQSAFINDFIDLYNDSSEVLDLLYGKNPVFPNIGSHNDTYDLSLKAGERIIIFGYSKGSIYANKSYEMMGRNNRFMGIIGIGIPVSYIHGDKYVTYEYDGAINSLRLRRLPYKIKPLPWNVSLEESYRALRENYKNPVCNLSEVHRKICDDNIRKKAKSNQRSHKIMKYISDKAVQRRLKDYIIKYVKTLPLINAKIKDEGIGAAMNSGQGWDMDLHILETNGNHINYMNDTGLGKLHWDDSGATESYNVSCSQIVFGGRSKIELIVGAVYDGIEGISKRSHPGLTVNFTITKGDSRQVFTRMFLSPTALGNGMSGEAARRLNMIAHRKPTWVGKIIIEKEKLEGGGIKYNINFKNIP